MGKFSRKIINIDQTEVQKLKFKKDDVLRSDKRKRERRRKLKLAVIKKKKKDGKVTIQVETSKRGMFRVESFVLMAGKQFIMLSGGTTLPIRAIKKIQL